MDQGEEERMSFTEAELAEPAQLADSEIELNEAALHEIFTDSLNTQPYEELKTLCYRISAKIYSLGFKLTLNIIDNNHLFYIRDNSNTIISSTNISLSEDSFTITIVGHPREVEDVPVFSVIAVDTHAPEHRGRGYALLLLIFSLSYLKIVNPEYKYSILDDATPTGTQMKGNIYTNLGYGIRGSELIQLDIRRKNTLMPGNKHDTGIKPERTLYLDDIGDHIDHLQNFIVAANSSLNKRGLLSGGKLTKKNRKSKKNRTKGKKNRTKGKKSRKY